MTPIQGIQSNQSLKLAVTLQLVVLPCTEAHRTENSWVGHQKCSISFETDFEQNSCGREELQGIVLQQMCFLTHHPSFIKASVL